MKSIKMCKKKSFHIFLFTPLVVFCHSQLLLHLLDVSLFLLGLLLDILQFTFEASFLALKFHIQLGGLDQLLLQVGESVCQLFYFFFFILVNFGNLLTFLIQASLSVLDAEWSTLNGPDFESLCSDWLNLYMMVPRSMP